MGGGKHHVCPAAVAGILDNRIRRWLQNPEKILRPYVEEGMTVLDLGCGSGFFSVDIARMVGGSGRIIAADLQEGMLRKLRDKIRGSEFERRVTLHRCEENRIGLSGKVDFVLAFYVIHEIPDQEGLFNQLYSMVRPEGRLFIVEPPLHVSAAAFRETVRKARDAGFEPVKSPKVFLGTTVILKRAGLSERP